MTIDLVEFDPFFKMNIVAVIIIIIIIIIRRHLRLQFVQ